MPQKRTDAEYIQQRIRELYQNHTAKEVAMILNNDPNVVAPVTERIVFNVLQKIRKQFEDEPVYKDKPWSEEEDAVLRQWYAKGASIPLIAQQLSRSISSVHGRIRTLKLANRKITPDQERVIRAMIRCTNKSLQEIAYELCVKYQAVRHVSNKMKKELGDIKRHASNTSYWEEGSLAERLIRDALIERYGDAVVPWRHNREWSQGRGWQIDIPIEFPNGLKVAVEVNHVRVHANRRNWDYAKRRLAEQLGWVWVPIWFDGELTKEAVTEAIDTINRIIDELQRGKTAFYQLFIKEVEERERHYYYPEQPVYDPKEGVHFGPAWSDADIAMVRDNYGKVPLEELQNMLSTPRTREAIFHKARILGLTKKTKNFTPEEDAIIRELYPTGTEEEILAKLPGRTWKSIASRASRLGVKRHDHWTSEEDAILTENYSTVSDEELLNLLPGRSLHSIRSRANKLGLKKESMWSLDEDNELRRVYPEESREVIQATFPNRTWLAIVSRASRLGLRRTKPF
jgi:predicted DNA-binding protein YlxM (UPF0122 family)